MTTPRWTVDDDGRLVYPLADRDGVEARAIYIGPATFAVLWPDHPGEGESHDAHARLVADVAAARRGPPALAWCPACTVERCDYEVTVEGPQHLDACPNCGSDDAPLDMLGVVTAWSAAARLVDDMAAVEKIVADALRTISNDWQPTEGPGFPLTREQSLASMSGTIAHALIAALHHARRRETRNTMADEGGLYDKYEVYRTDGKGIGQCVVLEFDDPNTWPALLTWADTVEAAGNGQLARDVRDKVAAHQHLAALHHARRQDQPRRITGEPPGWEGTRATHERAIASLAPSDHARRQWTVRDSALGAIVEHPDGTSLRPMNSRVGETSDQVARRVAAALNVTADLTALADAVRKHEAEPGLMVWKDCIVAVARALVASTGTETP